MAPSELLIMYVVFSRIGNSPRHFKSSSILQGSIEILLGTDLSPHKVAQRNEHKPGDSSLEGDAQAGDPPCGNKHRRERCESESGTPWPARRKTEWRLRPLGSLPAKHKVGHENHLPDKNAAEERRSQHVNEIGRASC